MVYAVLLAAANCAKDPHAALNHQTPSFQYAMVLDRAPSDVTRSAGLQSPTPSYPLVPVCSLAAFRVQSTGCLTRDTLLL